VLLLLSIEKEQAGGVLLQRKEEIYKYCVSRGKNGKYGMWNMRYFINVINIDIDI
jgi:hypothetical protein